MPVNVTATGTTYSENVLDEFITFSFTPSADITYQAGDVYFSVVVTDSTATTPIVKEYAFKKNYATGGTIATTDDPIEFAMLNADNLVSPLTGSDGKIIHL